MKNKLRWKRDYGDGEITDDVVLWINDEPTDISISGAEGGYYGILYYGSQQLAIADTRKELKKILFEEFKDIVDSEILNK